MSFANLDTRIEFDECVRLALCKPQQMLRARVHTHRSLNAEPHGWQIEISFTIGFSVPGLDPRRHRDVYI